MIKYKVIHHACEIEQVEVESETEHFVTNSFGYRDKKITRYATYCDTLEEAEGVVTRIAHKEVERAEKRVVDAERALRNSKIKLEKIIDRFESAEFEKSLRGTTDRQNHFFIYEELNKIKADVLRKYGREALGKCERVDGARVRYHEALGAIYEEADKIERGVN